VPADHKVSGWIDATRQGGQTIKQGLFDFVFVIIEHGLPGHAFF
jgi:hypothetical protein